MAVVGGQELSYNENIDRSCELKNKLIVYEHSVKLFMFIEEIFCGGARILVQIQFAFKYRSLTDINKGDATL